VAYPSYLAATLSGASLRQLQYWREQKLMPPELGRSGDRGRVLYSFRDVVALRTFVFIRQSHSLQSIRKALGTLRDLGNREHLSQYTLVPDGDEIVLVRDTDLVALSNRPGQGVATFMRDIYEPFENMQGVWVVDLLRPRDLVEVDPAVHGGYPVIAGTRVQYDLVASLVEDGVPPVEIEGYYTSVSAEAARDAASFSEIVAGYKEGRVPSAA
jgi:uncharacterized protein (DUF433 family)/DNA-binding transcriptional MerR regulator